MAVQHIEKIRELRNKGMTYQSIANEIGISRQQTWYSAKVGGIVGHEPKSKNIIYNGIHKWLIKHKMSLHDFCIKCGEDFGCNSRTWRFLVGTHKGDIVMIKKILDACGLTFEEAFGEVINEAEKEN